MINSNTFPILATKRLSLRQLKTTDDQAIFKIRSNEIVYKYIAKQTFKQLEEAQEFIAKINDDIAKERILFWAITLKETHELVGTICLWNFSNDKLIAEVGYELLPAYYKKGIMNEALSKVLEFGFGALNLNSIEAFTHRKNKASKNTFNKTSF